MTRRLGNGIYTRDSEYSNTTKERAQAAAKRKREFGYKARVLPGETVRGKKTYTVYYHR